MIGSNSAVNIADAYLKAIRGYDVETLYEAIRKNATTSVGRPGSVDGKTISAVGREEFEYYNRLGYVPYDVGINENAARTLEYAYADFAISHLAEALGKTEDAAMFRARAQNYRKLFDPATGWLRGRNPGRQLPVALQPAQMGRCVHRRQQLHCSWSLFQDVRDLIDLMGGDRAFAGKIDKVFESQPKFDDSYYGFTIRDTREKQIVNMGSYAHGNQPIQYMIYLYDYAGAPWKTQASSIMARPRLGMCSARWASSRSRPARTSMSSDRCCSAGPS